MSGIQCARCQEEGAGGSQVFTSTGDLYDVMRTYFSTKGFSVTTGAINACSLSLSCHSAECGEDGK